MNHDTARPCVLVAEDELLLVMLIEDVLVDAGYRVLKAARADAALALAEDHHTRIAAALLDIDLAGGKAYPVARQLRRRGVPFLFATAYGVPDLPPEFDNCLILQKPYAPGAIVRAVEALLH